MDMLDGFLNWAWARHHNPLSWYIRPFFVVPFCYFAYKKNWWGMSLTALAVLSSMFWFPEPATVDPQATAFLAMERQALLKVIWSFYFGGQSAWTIVPSAAFGFVVCTGIYWYAYRRLHPITPGSPEASA